MTASVLHPDVSILIPYHNCREMTENCLRSLAEHTRGVTWELVLIDDASTEQPDYENLLPGIHVQVMRNDSRKSYSENNNQAAAIARGKWLCLLNNDTTVTPGWLEGLVQVCLTRPRLGVLGNMHLYPHNGKVQHAGMGFDEKDMPLHLNPGADPLLPSVNWERAFQAVTFACVMIPREVYTALGGLDTAYRNGFEDVDFCLRARAAGWEVRYTPGSVIRHFGQSTPGRTDHDNENWILFRGRWGGKVQRDLMELAQEDRALNRSAPPLSPPGLHIDIDLQAPNAFLWGTVELILALKKRGIAVSIPRQTGMHRSITGPARKLLKSCMSFQPFQRYHIKWTHYWTQHYRAPLFGDVNAEFFCTNYRYRRDKRCLDLWMRHVRINEYRKLPVARFNLEALEDISVPASDCSVMPLGYAPEAESLFPRFEDLPAKDPKVFKLLLVTNSHDLHRYGTDLAVEALGKAYTDQDPVEIHLKDYGAGASSETLKTWIAAFPAFPRIVWHTDFLEKEALMRLYADMDAQLAPFRGEGFSMKILDAAALGVPTLMPLFGGPTEYSDPETCFALPYREVPVGRCYDREEFYLGEGAYWCEAGLEAMVDCLRKLPQQRELCREKGRKAFEAVRGRFSWDAAAGKLMEALETWDARRRTRIAPRLGPDRLGMSVVIPTKDRPDALELTLKAYLNQTLPRDQWEMILVNDHGDRSILDAVCARFPELPIRLLDNPGPGGPGAARNFAIEQAAGTVILITGDDIVPTPDFLARHAEAHRSHSEITTAFVGRTLWHPDLPQTPFMSYIDGEGGQQFKYNDLRDGGTVPFDRLYTSNCSLKRRFLAQQEVLFSSWYRFAAFEDVELGYRLHLRGMTLRYLEHANGYHYHLMTPESFVQRQRKVGRMLTLMALQRPGYVPNEHWTYLKGLELLRSRPDLLPPGLCRGPDPEVLLQELLKTYNGLLEQANLLGNPIGRAVSDRESPAWQKWMHLGSRETWEACNQMALRLGMTEEWMEEGDDPRAPVWTTLLLMPNLIKFAGIHWDMPFVRHEATQALLPDSRLVYTLAKILRNTPGLGGLVVRLEHSPKGKYLRGILGGMLQRLRR